MKKIFVSKKPVQQLLAKEFTTLVNWSVTLLGQVIKKELGLIRFEQIEEIRRFVKLKKNREVNQLLKLKQDLQKKSPEDQLAIAHAFALMMELINSCETAYRSYRLLDEKKALVEETSSGTKGCTEIIHVLTAHPTESRNPEMIYFFNKIQNLLLMRLQNSRRSQETKLASWLHQAWNLPMSKQRKPSVMDEAEYIYSLVLRPEIFDLLVENEQAKRPFSLRTWVGGDKDGNPFVDENTMLGSLRMSRNLILNCLSLELSNYIEDLQQSAKSGLRRKEPIRSLLRLSKIFKKSLKKIKQLNTGDAQKVALNFKLFLQISKQQTAIFKIESQALSKIHSLFKIFPGLVVPLELREASSLVHEALQSPRKSMNISRMLATLSRLCPEHSLQNYARGFILSQCESAADLNAGVALTQKFCAGRLPVVPLFESAHSLSNSAKIVEQFLSSKTNLKLVQKNWSSQFEVMLGYSDSAKENGVFPSRLLVQSAIIDLEAVIQRYQLSPVFFHGSGGSIERGGGSIQEQTEWWPLSALSKVKMTIQGEMVYRNYSSPWILQRQLNLLAQNCRERLESPQVQISMNSKAHQKLLNELSDFIKRSYKSMLRDPDFLDLIERATPYSFLKDLKLGSRPSKRQGAINLEGLRAIPWVLCWTQTRILFPTWWGIGSFWKTQSPLKKKKFQQVFNESALFRSYVKALGFTLKKIELDIFFLYLKNSKMDSAKIKNFEKLFKSEYAAALECVHEITGEDSLLWYRPWLEASIELRSPLIHPLNVLQMIAFENKDISLIRETITGVAIGMLTTG
jgi:phosphoenolpyruvate carboxylase